MENLLRLISICFSILFYSNIYSQNWKFGVEIPIVLHQVSSPSEIPDELYIFSNDKKYIPNLTIHTTYKSFVFGVSRYYFKSHNKSTSRIEGILVEMILHTYSLYIGKECSFRKLNLMGGIGVTYNDWPIAFYNDYYPRPWEVWTCTEENTWGPMFWSSLRYNAYKGINIGLNIRLNPMLMPFKFNKNNPCSFPHTHDRIHYLVTQITLGYVF